MLVFSFACFLSFFIHWRTTFHGMVPPPPPHTHKGKKSEVRWEHQEGKLFIAGWMTFLGKWNKSKQTWIQMTITFLSSRQTQLNLDKPYTQHPSLPSVIIMKYLKLRTLWRKEAYLVNHYWSPRAQYWHLISSGGCHRGGIAMAGIYGEEIPCKQELTRGVGPALFFDQLLLGTTWV